MNNLKTPDEKFLEAQIALLMDASPEELDEYLVAAGLDPRDLENRGMNAIKGALTNLQVAKRAAALSELSPARQREVAGHLGTPSAQHKSDTAPTAPVRVPFEQLLREAGMSEDEIAELMREDG